MAPTIPAKYGRGESESSPKEVVVTDTKEQNHSRSVTNFSSQAQVYTSLPNSPSKENHADIAHADFTQAPPTAVNQGRAEIESTSRPRSSIPQQHPLKQEEHLPQTMKHEATVLGPVCSAPNSSDIPAPSAVREPPNIENQQPKKVFLSSKSHYKHSEASPASAPEAVLENPTTSAQPLGIDPSLPGRTVRTVTGPLAQSGENSEEHQPSSKSESGKRCDKNSDEQGCMEDVPISPFNGKNRSYADDGDDLELDIVKTTEYPKVEGRLAKQGGRIKPMGNLRGWWNEYFG